jgi:hypothetical protein
LTALPETEFKQPEILTLFGDYFKHLARVRPGRRQSHPQKNSKRSAQECSVSGRYFDYLLDISQTERGAQAEDGAHPSATCSLPCYQKNNGPSW